MNIFRFRVSAWAGCASILLLALPALQLHGQSPAWKLDGPAFSASVEDLQKAAAAVPPEKFIEATVFFERDAYRSMRMDASPIATR